jgi:AcrR family transcriptional regulator
LLDAGVALARAAGPEAIVLREATRRAGVAPNAAYRHFANRDALLDAVRDVALSRVAQTMEARLAVLGMERATAAYARAALRAVGMGYLSFARTERGLFRAAFGVPFGRADDTRTARRGDSGLDPFQLLGASLDRMVKAKILPSGSRPGAEYLAWSAVHGMAMLFIDGPLKDLSALQFEALGNRLVDMVEVGLTGGGVRAPRSGRKKSA